MHIYHQKAILSKFLDICNCLFTKIDATDPYQNYYHEQSPGTNLKKNRIIFFQFSLASFFFWIILRQLKASP